MNFFKMGFLVFVLLSCATKNQTTQNSESQDDLMKVLDESLEISRSQRSPEQIAAFKKNQEKVLGVDWSKSHHQEILWDFVVKNLTVENGVLSTPVPSSAFAVHNMASWIDFFNLYMDSCSVTVSELSVQKKCYALQSMMSTGLSKLISSPDKALNNENLLQALSRIKDKISLVYEDWNLNYNNQVVSLKWPYFDHGFYLEMGTWLGDRRSFEVAKRAIESKEKKMNRIQSDNYQLALLVMSGFLDDKNSAEAKKHIQSALRDREISKNFKSFLSKVLSRSGAKEKSSKSFTKRTRAKR